MSSRRSSSSLGKPSSGQKELESRSVSAAATSEVLPMSMRSGSQKPTDRLEDSVVLECKAAYISVVKGASIEKSLTSKSDLLLALQNAGRNPTQRTLSKYWTKSTEDVSFDGFCRICQKEPVTTSDDLMKAFKKIDINGDGFISHSELKKVMTTKGERMTDEEVSRLIDEVDENRDGKLDYKEFSNMVLNTSKQCKETASRRYEKKKPTSRDSSKIEKGSKERKDSVNGKTEDNDNYRHDHREHNSSSKEQNFSGLRENNSVGSKETDSRSGRELNTNTNASTARERRNSSADRESKRSVPRSPRMSPRTIKGAKNKEEQKDKFGSQTSLRSYDSRNGTHQPSEKSGQKNNSLYSVSSAKGGTERSEKPRKRGSVLSKGASPTKSVNGACQYSTPPAVIQSGPCNTPPVVIEGGPSKTASAVIDGCPSKTASAVIEDGPSKTVSAVIEGGPSKTASAVIESGPSSTPPASEDGSSCDDDDDVVIFASPKNSKARRGDSSPRGPMPRPRLSSGVERRTAAHSTEESPKPAPRRLSRQETPKAAIASLSLKLQTPKNLADWRAIKRRGMFYVEDNGEISSSQFTLVITKSTSVWISIIPSPSQSTAPVSTPLDMCVLVIRTNSDKKGNSLITFTERRDTEGNFGVRCDLEPGKYHLLTYTSGCGLPVCAPSTEPQKKLVRKKSGGDGDQYTLTKEFKYILTDIFNMVDTDMNGLLSRNEFSAYSERTGEEKVGDDEWNVVKENAELKQGELTCKGFMQLIELEADDAGGDTDDLWVALEALGYDSSLVQNQAYPFTLEVSLETDANSSLTAQPSCITTKSRALQSTLKEAYVSKGELLSSENRCRAAKSSGNDKDVRIHCYETDIVVAVLIENKLPARVTVKLDCGASKNVKSNTQSLSEIFAVPGNSTTAAFHFVPKDETKEWFVSCVEKDLQSSTA